MNKDFSKNKLLSLSAQRQLKVLYDLAQFIETKQHSIDSQHFSKLAKYHSFLATSENEKIQKLNKEFIKIKATDYQFQVYLMNLERFLGQSKKDYAFLVQTQDIEIKEKKDFPIACLLDSVRSAHNVGAMFRNAECFNCNEVYLTGLSATPNSVHVQKTAMGCDQNIQWSYYKSAIELIKKLKQEKKHIWAIETSARSLNINEIQNIPSPLVLIFGHEQHGISQELLELCDEIISIPMYGSKNSLNVSVSQAIILNQLVSKINS